MEKFRKAIATFFVQKRKEAGLSQQAAAKKTGIPLSNLVSFEDGSLSLGVNILGAMVRIYGVPPQEFMEMITMDQKQFLERNKKE